MAVTKAIKALLLWGTPWYVDVELQASEEISLDGVASFFRGIRPTGGRLILTNERIVYMAMYARFVPKLWRRMEIPISEIKAVTGRSPLRGLWGGVPGLPLFRIYLKGGGDFTFQTIFAGHWRREVQRLIADEPRP